MKSVYEIISSSIIPEQDGIAIGCPIIEEVLGLIKSRIIYEISGEAGVGKTQFCLTLAIRSIIQNMNLSKARSVAYISCGEGDFPIRRLNDLAISYSEMNESIRVDSLLSKFYIEKCYNSENLLENILKDLPALIQKANISLVIIDSIAGVVRTEFNTSDKENIYQRSNLLFRISNQLKWIADTFDVTVIVVNQVSQNISKSNENNTISKIKPALGLAWSHCVNVRILLSRYSISVRSGENSDENPVQSIRKFRRYLNLEFSPNRLQRECSFEITEYGLVGIL